MAQSQGFNTPNQQLFHPQQADSIGDRSTMLELRGGSGHNLAWVLPGGGQMPFTGSFQFIG